MCRELFGTGHWLLSIASQTTSSAASSRSRVACFEAFESQGKQEGLKDDFFTIWNFTSVSATSFLLERVDGQWRVL